MRGIAIRFSIAVFSLAIAYLLVEGAVSVWRGRDLGQSLGWTVYETAKGRQSPEQGFRETVVVDERAFEELLPAFQDSGVGLGNTPYAELKVEENQMNSEGECLRLKPNQKKSMRWLRTLVFEPFNQVVAFYDRERELHPRVERFLQRYADRAVEVDSNGTGERLTLPEVEREEIVLVAGDSVAFGAGVGNGDTIASQLQLRDETVQYVNLGVGGARGADIVCNLDEAARRYAGRIRGLIYVYCENDFETERPYGSPREVIPWLRMFAEDNGIDEVTVVFAPYIFNVFPGTTRVRGTRGWRHPFQPEEISELRELAGSAGFGWVDIGELAEREAEERGSVFGGLAMFVDIVHLSPAGAATVAQEILPPDDGVVPAGSKR